MKFNVAKCKVMHLGRGNACENNVMREGTLGTVHEERDLGVRITNDLKASALCDNVCSRANRVLGMIRFANRVCDEWNRLDGDVVAVGSVNAFKRKLPLK